MSMLFFGVTASTVLMIYQLTWNQNIDSLLRFFSTDYGHLTLTCPAGEARYILLRLKASQMLSCFYSTMAPIPQPVIVSVTVPSKTQEEATMPDPRTSSKLPCRTTP
jgi:hypothetical protein